MSGPYDEEDAAEDCDDTTSEVSRAWHDAREDCQEEGWYGSDKWGRGSKGKSKDRR